MTDAERKASAFWSVKNLTSGYRADKISSAQMASTLTAE
jgi:hypothetical protein